MTATSRPVLRYFGGKWSIAPWIIEHFPAHRIYVEPFGGGGSVLLRKPRTYAEIYNDLDGEIVNVFRVVRDRGDELARAITLTPYALEEFELSYQPAEDQLERARRTVVRSFMGYGGNLTRDNRDQTPQRTGFRYYSGSPRAAVPAKEWTKWPDQLKETIDRLRGVTIEQRDAIEVMLKHDGPDTLHYVDPPYPHVTRGPNAGGSHRGYRFEMTDEEHERLASVLLELKGMVVLSGYDCELYERLFASWPARRRATVADGARPRVEVLWLNQACAGQQRQAQLLESAP